MIFCQLIRKKLQDWIWMSAGWTPGASCISSAYGLLCILCEVSWLNFDRGCVITILQRIAYLEFDCYEWNTNQRQKNPLYNEYFLQCLREPRSIQDKAYAIYSYENCQKFTVIEIFCKTEVTGILLRQRQ